jgi:AcrR family transcriptional regulator
MTTKYAKTMEKLAEALNVTREHLTRRYASKDDFPKKTKQGYDIAAVSDFIAKDRKRHVVGDGSLKDKKLIVEIEILEAKRDEIRRTLIPVDEHLAELQQFHQIGVAVMDQWISVVSSITKDAKAVEGAENLRRTCVEQWREKLQAVNA